MSGLSCRHPDVRKFDGLRCCLACGETVFEYSGAKIKHGLTQDPNKRFEYRKLNYIFGQEIRLCELLPGMPTDPLQCELIHANLEDDPLYDAVSYTWATEQGDAILSTSIQCGDGSNIPITANCSAVLRQLRRHALRRRLWIDAICIDQANVMERNHQVNLMDQIYRRAQIVRICIPDETLPPSYTTYRELFTWLQHDHSEADTVRLHQTLVHLLRLRYFSRVWVIQEVALARTASLHINDDALSLTSKVFERLQQACLRVRGALPAVLSWDLGRQSNFDIVSCLLAGFQSKSTEPRDKIFAVLSLMDSHSRSLISVDYSVDIAQVFTHAIIAVIDHVRELDVLMFVDTSEADSHRSTFGLSGMQFEEYLHYRQSMRRPLATPYSGLHPTQFVNDSIGPWRAAIGIVVVNELKSLPVLDREEPSPPAMICRRPYKHTSMNIQPQLHIRAHFIDIIEKIPALELLKGRDPPPYNYTDLDQYRWGTKRFPELFPFFQSTPSDDATNYSALSETNDNYISPQDLSCVDHADLRIFCNGAEDFGRHCVLFFTRNTVGFASSRIGFARDTGGFALKGFLHGDEIWAVDGVRSPLILRKTVDKKYRIVCACYVWAALELDYWNPGTKKGRWGEEVTRRPGEETQTHIIEIS